MIGEGTLLLIVAVIIFLYILAAPSNQGMSSTSFPELDDFVRKEKEARIFRNEQQNRERELREKEARLKHQAELERKERLAKKQTLDNFFGKVPANYNRSDEFEKQEFIQKNQDKERELDYRNFKSEIREKSLEQDKNIFEVRSETVKITERLQEEMRQGFYDVNLKLLNVEKVFMSFKEYVTEKFAQVDSNMKEGFQLVNEQITNLRLEVKSEVSDLKLQFGQEILRLDKQQLIFINKLQEYSNHIKAFSNEMQKVKLDAERFNLQGREMLSRAELAHEKSRVEISNFSKDLEVGLKQVAIHKSDFANKVGQAKLMLDNISQEQYLTLKQMAFERMGINLVRQENQQKHQNELVIVEQKHQEVKHLQERIRTELSHGRQVEGLQHQLYITQENLNYHSNRANLIRQENSLMSRLSR